MKFLISINEPKLRFWVIVFLTLIISGKFSAAQNANFSPYSRYGIGDLQFRGFAWNSAMGGIGTAVSDAGTFNLLNPASLHSLNVTSFGAAVNSDFISLSNGVAKQSSNRTGLGYLSLSFPLMSKKWGAGFGILPFSNTGYRLEQNISEPQVGNVRYQYEGSGGINQFFLSTGYALTPRLNTGLTASFLFGPIERLRNIEFPDSVNFFNTKVTNTVQVSDFNFTLGLLYDLIKKEKNTVTIGISASPSADIDAKRNTLIQRYNSIGSLVFIKDTIQDITGEKGIIVLPLAISGGISFRSGEKLLAGIDAGIQDWSEYKSFGESDSLTNSFRLATGIRYKPSESTSATYWNRAKYYGGAKYNKTYLQLRDMPLNEYGITFGIGLPVRRTALGKSWSYLDIALEAGQRGTTDKSLIREQYIRMVIGFNLNDDTWFIKRKYD
jgi:hypothetical protein